MTEETYLKQYSRTDQVEDKNNANYVDPFVRVSAKQSTDSSRYVKFFICEIVLCKQN